MWLFIETNVIFCTSCFVLRLWLFWCGGGRWRGLRACTLVMWPIYAITHQTRVTGQLRTPCPMSFRVKSCVAFELIVPLDFQLFLLVHDSLYPQQVVWFFLSLQEASLLINVVRFLLAQEVNFSVKQMYTLWKDSEEHFYRRKVHEKDDQKNHLCIFFQTPLQIPLGVEVLKLKGTADLLKKYRMAGHYMVTRSTKTDSELYRGSHKRLLWGPFCSNLCKMQTRKDKVYYHFLEMIVVKHGEYKTTLRKHFYEVCYYKFDSLKAFKHKRYILQAFIAEVFVIPSQIQYKN